MNHRSTLTVLTLFILAILASGCSETTKQAPALPDVVFPVQFPMIENASLYSFENEIEYGIAPEENQTNQLIHKLLLTSPTGLILALDTDKSTKSNIDDIETLSHTALPEYIAYAKKQTLHIYELDTRYDHQVYSFQSDEFFEPSNQTEVSPSWFICDLQKVITWDEESRIARKILFKDEFAVYVKTSSLEDCSEPSDGFKFWQINIADSSNPRDTFTIRRKLLKEHSHFHRHVHNHDDENDELFSEHNHSHPLEEGELDENGEEFKKNDHTHKHTHTHDFVYGPEHPHQHLTSEETDVVHNDPFNQEIDFETHPKLIGKRTTITSIDEALMYSGIPVVNTATRTFGYMGFDTKAKAINFYSVDKDNLKSLLWREQNENLAGLINAASNHTDWRVIVPAYNRPSNFSLVNKGIIFFNNDKLFHFPLESLFDDDDETEIRSNSLENPLFTSTSTMPLSQNSQYSVAQKKMTLTVDKDLWLIDFNAIKPAPTLIKAFNESNLDRIQAHVLESNILVTKYFNDGTTIRVSSSLLEESGIETSTLLQKTTDQVIVNAQPEITLFSILKSDNNMNVASYLENISGIVSTAFLDTIWVEESFDYRNNLETKIITQLSSDDLTTIPGTIEQPWLFVLDTDMTAGRGETINFIQDAVMNASNFVIFNEFYSILEYQDTNDENQVLNFLKKY